MSPAAAAEEESTQSKKNKHESGHRKKWSTISAIKIKNEHAMIFAISKYNGKKTSM